MESQVREHRHRTGKNGAVEMTEAVPGQPGGPAYRVLHVDDSATDRTLVARELQREIPDLSITAVDNKISLEEALLEPDFDLVITDYELRWTDGLTIINRLRADNPDLPVLMYTGSGNEEIAVEAMKAGVQDYILMDPKNFPRLRASVLQALERMRYSVDIAKAEARYKELFETVPVGFFLSTPQGAAEQSHGD